VNHILRVSLRYWVVVWLLGIALILPAEAITLDANFDHGSLKSYSVQRTLVTLEGRDNFAGSGHFVGSGNWRWMYFKASGVEGLVPTFSASSNFAGDLTPGPHELTDHEMVYSYDGEEWFFFDNNQLGATTYTFSNNYPFAHNEVHVAYAIPYTYGRTVEHTQKVMSSPWAMPTNSGDANGVIGQSPAGVDELGRNIPALDLFAYRITNPETDATNPNKRRALFTTGQHVGETLGIYTYEGLINWLISDDPRAAAVRDQVEVFAYPVLNASGRYAGLTRAMLGHPNTDSNGFWSPTRWADRPEQRTLGEAILADVEPGPGKIIDFAVDFHSSVPDYTIVGPNGEGTAGRDDWGYVKTNQGDHLNPLWLTLRELQPNILQVSSGGGANTMIGFAQNFLNADLDITFENQFAISRPVQYYHDLGRNFGLAIYEAWIRVPDPNPADFDQDGDVDFADLAAWQIGFGMSGGADFYHGDADGDGIVDGSDFLTWQREFGSLSLSEAQAAVPEPASAILLLIASQLLMGRKGVSRKSLCG